ncbi:MAG: sigma-54-dependent Fis family transcriptional regulator, partial [Acidobacteria bacterium]|nr:sigma-54-dependent Fis family transcriptional regulator [Acidobacteriota bacterium]
MKPTRVLIVDDEPGIQDSLRGVLEDEGYTARAVGSGEECLHELATGGYEVVLLDVWLPGIDGLETLQRIRASEMPGPPAVIMISGHGNIETAVRATKLGAFDFLEKPLTIEKVLVVLKNALEQRRLHLALEELRDSGRG